MSPIHSALQKTGIVRGYRGNVTYSACWDEAFVPPQQVWVNKKIYFATEAEVSR